MPIISGGGGAAEFVKTVTAAVFRDTFATPIEIAPAPGPGLLIANFTVLVTLSSDFVPFTGAFTPHLSTSNSSPLDGVLWDIQPDALYQALAGGSPGDLIAVWLNGNVGSVWTGPASLAPGASLWLNCTAAAPAGGAGSFTIATALTNLTCPVA